MRQITCARDQPGLPLPDIVSVPRFVAASGDYTQWSVARDHDNLVYYVRSYDSWTTDSHDLQALGATTTGARSSLPRPT